MSAPVTRDQELELTIDSLAYGGNGVARLDGFVVFVRRGLPGDTVRARVTKVKRRHAEALAIEVLEPGPQRVEAPCAHYPACGGCRFQDLAYEAQLESKQAQVGDALRRIGGIAEPPLEPIVPADAVFHYRNKLEYSFTPARGRPDARVPQGGPLGRGARDRALLAHDRPRQRDPQRGARVGARGQARRLLQAEQTGYLRHLVVREGRNTGQALVQLVTAPGEKFDTGGFVDALRRFPEVRSIHWSVNESPAEVTNLPTQLLWGEDAIEEELCGLRFRVRPNAFLQTNTAMAERLYELAREFAGLTGGETVYDLYCGIGTIGLVARPRRSDRVGDRGLGGVGRVRARERRSERDRERGVLRRQRRTGARGAARAARRAGRRRRRSAAGGARRQGAEAAWRDRRAADRLRLCNPTTLAGDVKGLDEEYGYRLLRAKPVDMFPHTPHVETVALLERSAGSLLNGWVCQVRRA